MKTDLWFFTTEINSMHVLFMSFCHRTSVAWKKAIPRKLALLDSIRPFWSFCPSFFCLGAAGAWYLSSLRVVLLGQSFGFLASLEAQAVWVALFVSPPASSAILHCFPPTACAFASPPGALSLPSPSSQLQVPWFSATSGFLHSFPICSKLVSGRVYLPKFTVKINQH